MDAFKAGFDSWLAQLQSEISAQVFGENLPLLGKALSDPANQNAAALNHVTAIRGMMVSAMNSLTGSAPYTEAQFTGLNISLNPNGTINITFSAPPALPPGYSVELQSSTDAGQTDPWTAIAAWTGKPTWTGSATVLIAPGSGGNNSITVSVQPTDEPKRFFRLVILSM